MVCCKSVVFVSKYWFSICLVCTLVCLFPSYFVCVNRLEAISLEEQCSEPVTWHIRPVKTSRVLRSYLSDLGCQIQRYLTGVLWCVHSVTLRWAFEHWQTSDGKRKGLPCANRSHKWVKIHSNESKHYDYFLVSTQFTNPSYMLYPVIPVPLSWCAPRIVSPFRLSQVMQWCWQHAKAGELGPTGWTGLCDLTRNHQTMFKHMYYYIRLYISIVTKIMKPLLVTGVR